MDGDGDFFARRFLRNGLFARRSFATSVLRMVGASGIDIVGARFFAMGNARKRRFCNRGFFLVARATSNRDLYATASKGKKRWN